MTPKRSSTKAAAIAAVILVLASRPASAQLKGHYIPGFSGLDNGSQPPPGLSLAVPVFVYPTDTIKDDDGNDFAAHPNITASFIGAGLLAVTNARILWANVGVQVIPVALMKSRIEGANLDVPGEFAFTDDPPNRPRRRRVLRTVQGERRHGAAALERPVRGKEGPRLRRGRRGKHLPAQGGIAPRAARRSGVRGAQSHSGHHVPAH